MFPALPSPYVYFYAAHCPIRTSWVTLQLTLKFCSNILTVPKPSDGQDPSKAAQNIRRHENKTREATRVVIDLRGVNKLTVPLPAIALSSYKDL